MTSDLDLLRQFARENSQDAFTEIVRRHVNLIYSAALRQVRSPQLAEEIAQSVFADLARNADKLSNATGGPPVLAAWLYSVTRRTAIDAIRKESRRQLREQIAVEMTNMNATANDWTQIEPLLDDAMDALDETDRSAILLRYFENKNLREVGENLKISDDAAQKRVSRAVERLREFFSKQKITIGASGLAVLISANAVQSAPMGLAATISAAAVLTGTAAYTSTVIAATKTIAMTTLQKTIVGAAFVAAVGTGIFEAHQTSQLRGENQLLQQQVDQLQTDNESLSKRVAQAGRTPHLPAPQIQVAVVATNALPEENVEPTNLWARLKDKQIKLTHEQIESYLKANGRTATSLLAAFRTSGDPALLKEAMEKFPNDPQVDFEAAVDKDLSPDEQRQWLNTFKQSAPDNALANYLSALNYFNSGQIDQGVQELSAASGKSLDDYTVSRAENDMEAYLTAGYSVADADELGTSQLLLPQLAQMKQLGLDAVDLANAYSQAGDSSSAQAVLQMAANLGQGYATPSSGESEISQLVGIFIEQKALQAMNPNSPYGNGGQTVQDHLNELAQQRASVKELDQQVSNLLPEMSDQDWVIYKNRWLMFGEENAQSWVVNKYGQK
ncbi:MAG TPA: sigma-70 family RNA polymerase sigma factor [Candidatus Dormibacteraeota bacterium]|jgi:RNA polymerase sigma factor (sigma-70 family)|nr:sigma-70 family RNA polymerase sigma factor [Candidatus Dormibacteraeota bacterium]